MKVSLQYTESVTQVAIRGALRFSIPVGRFEIQMNREPICVLPPRGRRHALEGTKNTQSDTVTVTSIPSPTTAAPVPQAAIQIMNQLPRLRNQGAPHGRPTSRFPHWRHLTVSLTHGMITVCFGSRISFGHRPL